MSRKNIADAYRNARDIGLDYERLGKLVRETSAAPKREKALEPLAELHARDSERRPLNEVPHASRT